MDAKALDQHSVRCRLSRKADENHLECCRDQRHTSVEEMNERDSRHGLRRERLRHGCSPAFERPEAQRVRALDEVPWRIRHRPGNHRRGGRCRGRAPEAVGAVEAKPGQGRKRPLGRLQLAAIPDASAATLEGFLAADTKKPFTMSADGWSGYRGLATNGDAHEAIKLSAGLRGLLAAPTSQIGSMASWP